jgi:putative flippase GtrA
MHLPFRNIKGWWLEASRFGKAQFSSSFATGLHWVLMTLLLMVHVNYLIATTCGAVLGAVTDFSLKKWWAFSARGGILYKQGLRYALVSALSAGFNALVAFILVEGLHMEEWPALMLASVIVGLGWNYPMHRLYVFAGFVGSSKERQRGVAS